MTANETIVFRLWQRLSPARQSGGLNGDGAIDISRLWELMDRERITDPVMREFYERALYAMDRAARDQAAKVSK